MKWILSFAGALLLVFNLVTATPAETLSERRALLKMIHENDLAAFRPRVGNQPSLVNWKDDRTGFTLLHFSLCNGRKEMAELLISMGADFTIPACGNVTPAGIVLWNLFRLPPLAHPLDLSPSDQFELFRLMFEKRPDCFVNLSLVDKTRRSILDYAILSVDEEPALFLLDNGFIVSPQWRENGRTVIEYCVDAPKPRILRRLLETLTAAELREAFIDVIRADVNGKKPFLDLLRERGVDLSPSANEAIHLLVHHASSPEAYRRDRPVMEALLSAYPRSVHPGETDLLHQTLKWNDTEMTRKLIAQGCEPDVYTLAGLGEVEALEKRLNRDPSLLTAAGPEGTRLLHWAGSPETARVLLKRNRDALNFKNAQGITPIDFPVVYGNDATVRFLIEHGARVKTPRLTVRAIEKNDPGMIRFLYPRHVSPKRPIRCELPWGISVTPLAYAIFREKQGIAEYLFSIGMRDPCVKAEKRRGGMRFSLYADAMDQYSGVPAVQPGFDAGRCPCRVQPRDFLIEDAPPEDLLPRSPGVPPPAPDQRPPGKNKEIGPDAAGRLSSP